MNSSTARALRFVPFVFALLLPGLLRAQPHGVPTCTLRLIARLTPDVPDPRNPAFLSALANNPAYSLTWAGHVASGERLVLRGPGPAYRCREELARMRRDSHVIDLQVSDDRGP